MKNMKFKEHKPLFFFFRLPSPPSPRTLTFRIKIYIFSCLFSHAMGGRVAGRFRIAQIERCMRKCDIKIYNFELKKMLFFLPLLLRSLRIYGFSFANGFPRFPRRDGELNSFVKYRCDNTWITSWNIHISWYYTMDFEFPQLATKCFDWHESANYTIFSQKHCMNQISQSTVCFLLLFFCFEPPTCSAKQFP